ncbi:hypothetical protein A7M01_18005 [Acinetobacter baumannii]|nr:hypothetical protein A7M01_18005 [Acinetobacter baumannii]
MIIGGTRVEATAETTAKLLPEGGDELGAPIANDRGGGAIEGPDARDERVNNVLDRYRGRRDVIAHLRKAVNNNQDVRELDAITAAGGKIRDEIDRDIGLGGERDA